jgi:hypothetical protein
MILMHATVRIESVVTTCHEYLTSQGTRLRTGEQRPSLYSHFMQKNRHEKYFPAPREIFDLASDCTGRAHNKSSNAGKLPHTQPSTARHTRSLDFHAAESLHRIAVLIALVESRAVASSVSAVYRVALDAR